MKVSKVDRYIMDHLRQRFPKSRDGELGTVQAALQSVAGPLMCLWSNLLDNNLLADKSVVINVHDVLNIIQQTLVLMGNTSELLLQAWRCNILQYINKTLEKYSKELCSNSQEFLLATSKVESDTTLSQVISLSKCFYPYGEWSRDLCQTTLGCSKQQFFERALLEKLGFGRANRPQTGSNTKKPHPRSTIHKTPQPPVI